MFRRIPLALMAAAAALAAQAQTPTPSAVPATAPVIESGNLSITRGEFEQMLASDPRMARANRDPGGMFALGTAMGRAFALESEARRRKLDQDPAVQLRIRNYTQQLLANELLVKVRQELLKEDKAVRAVYDAEIGNYGQPRVRQILVRFKGSEVAPRKGARELTVEQAKARADALLARLVKGADFAALARTDSDDLGSRDKGGDIGFVPKGSTPAEFESVAYSLPIGELSTVVKTAQGFHILRVEERQPIAYEKIRASIANDLAHKELDRLIADGYKLNSAYFGTPAGAAPAR